MPTVEKLLDAGKAFKMRTTRGDRTEHFSVMIHVSIKKADESRFQRRYDQCMHEIIDRVTGLLAASTPDERMEAGYPRLKEKVKKGINEMLGTPWVQQVLFSDVVYEVL